jgi:uncharacterized protein YbjT (DUF2867 family)
MNTVNTILVTGATGNVGTHVVEQLIARGAVVRAFVRDPNAAARRIGNVELAHGNFDDPASIQRALVGVDRVFLTAADGPDKVTHEQAMIDAAAAAGIELIVKLSALHADATSNLPAFAWHGEIERHLQRSGVPAVVLQPSFFMSNLLMVAGGVAATDTVYAPTGGTPVAMIDIGDVAAAAAVALLDDRYVGSTLQLTGPTPITFYDVAAALTRAVGRPIAYADLSDEEARPRFEGAGLPVWLQRHLAGVFTLIRSGAFATATNVVQQMTGRPATGIAEFARSHAAMFSADALADRVEVSHR